MQKPFSFALAAALTLAGAASIQSAVAEDTMTPVAGSATLSELSGEVVVINTETRLMTLKTENGTFEVLRIPPEVKRIKAIKVGDKVTISETEAVLVEIEKGRDAGAMGAVPEKTVEKDPGAKPAGTMVDKLTLYGKVLSVDKAKSQVTVQGPNQTVTLKVEDPALLKDLAPGDGVIARYVRVITGKVE
jgi:Cu/Ag efflux protein CusF